MTYFGLGASFYLFFSLAFPHLLYLYLFSINEKMKPKLFFFFLGIRALNHTLLSENDINEICCHINLILKVFKYTAKPRDNGFLTDSKTLG